MFQHELGPVVGIGVVLGEEGLGQFREVFLVIHQHIVRPLTTVGIGDGIKFFGITELGVTFQDCRVLEA